jgi:hypothetical protein
MVVEEALIDDNGLGGREESVCMLNIGLYLKVVLSKSMELLATEEGYRKEK